MRVPSKSLLPQLYRISCFEATKLKSMSLSQKMISHYSSLLTAVSPIKFLNTVKLSKQYSIGKKDIPLVTYEEIKKLTSQSSQILIDVREPNELQETGKIPASINIPLGILGQELAANADFKTKYGREKPEKNTEIIFHCRSGKRSQIAAELAKTLGYENTKNYLGSWLEYAEKEGLPK